MWEIEISTLTGINRKPEIVMLSFPTFVMGNLSPHIESKELNLNRIAGFRPGSRAWC